MVAPHDITRLSDKKQLHCCLWYATSCLNQPQHGKCDTSFGQKRQDRTRKSIITKFNSHIVPSGRKNESESIASCINMTGQRRTMVVFPK